MSLRAPDINLVRVLLFGLAGSGLCSPASAAREIDPVIATACSGKATGDSLRMRLAEAALVQAGVLGSDLLSDATLPPDTTFGQRAMVAVHRGTVSGFSDPTMDIRAIRQRLEQYLGPKSNRAAGDRKLEVVNPPPGQNWLFDPGRLLVLRCVNAKPLKPVIAQFETPTARSRLSVREKVDELALTGDAAKKAGAARIGLKRIRTEKDDGSTKTVTSLAINGTLGVRLTGNASTAPLYLYGTYALNRERTKPAPNPTKKQSDGDVSALETGLSINSLLIRSAADWSLVGSLQAAHVADFAHDARRLKLRASITPGFAGSLGPLCDIGGFSEATLLGLRFRTRCIFTLEAEASHVLKAGTADFKNHGEFFAVGGTAAYQVAAPIGDKAAVLGGIRYRFLPTIAGTAPNISRWDASLKYRFWLDGGPAIDLGFLWAQGNEPVSYTEEDKLEFGFGVVF